MTNYYTENMADFGSRERHMAAEILSKDFPHGFYDEGVRIAFNMSSGYVFLTNDDYQVAMLNGDKLALWHSTPYSGLEGFIEDLIAEHSPNDINSEDADYIIERAQEELIELPSTWFSYHLFKSNKERA
jgi:hypothetical protein